MGKRRTIVEFVEIDNVVLWVSFTKEKDNMGADEASAAGDQNVVRCVGGGGGDWWWGGAHALSTWLCRSLLVEFGYRRFWWK